MMREPSASRPRLAAWNLSATHPFEWNIYRIPGETEFLSQDIHGEIHAGFVLAGSSRGAPGTRQYDQNAGDFYLTGPWMLHCAHHTTDYEVLLLTIRLDELEHSLGPLGAKLELLFCGTALDLTRRCRTAGVSERAALAAEALQNLECAHIPEPYKRARQWTEIQCFFIDLLELTEAAKMLPEETQWHEQQRIQPALRLFSAGEFPISATRAAEACFLSAGRFNVLFKAAMGIPFSAFELRYRLNGVAADLLDTEHPLKDVAVRWGFFDPSHLIHVFTRNFGTTPGRWRQCGGRSDGESKP